MKSRLFDFFPIPKRLSMHTSGVAISDRAIQFVDFSHKKHTELESFGEIMLTDKSLDEGSIINADLFAKSLKELRDKHKLELVEVSIPEEKSYLFKTTVLGENIREIQNNIELHIQENVPFKTSEIVFDFSIIGEEENGKRDVIVSVLPKVVVDQYLNAFHSAGLTPTSFQVESQAVTQAVVPKENKDHVLVVNIQYDKVGFYIVTGQTVRFSSTVQIDTTPSEVIILDGTQRSKKDDNPYLSILVREIRKILTYWRTHDGSKDSYSIRHIYLTGTIKEELKMTDYIGNNISIPVEVSNVWQNSFSFDEMIPKMKRKDSLRYSAAIGLALDDLE